VLDGSCPPGIGHRIPSLHYEIVWNTPAFAHSTGMFVLANGDLTGYGFHGDFMNGWDIPTLQSAVSSCTNISGNFQDCPPFRLQNDSEASKCSFKMPMELMAEDCLGPRHLLPGKTSS
jgi:Domain of unknown function (DUF1996)